MVESQVWFLWNMSEKGIEEVVELKGTIYLQLLNDYIEHYFDFCPKQPCTNQTKKYESIVCRQTD